MSCSAQGKGLAFLGSQLHDGLRPEAKFCIWWLFSFWAIEISGGAFDLSLTLVRLQRHGDRRKLERTGRSS